MSRSSSCLLRRHSWGRLLLSSIFCGATTLRAESDDTVQMLGNLKTVLGRQLILKRFQFGGKEFDDATTFGTNHVIVMLMLVIVFVVSAPVAKADLAGQPCFRQEFQRAIDRGLSDARVFLLDQAIKVFAGKMLFRAQEHVENQVALGRALEPLLLNMFEKNFLLFSH